MLYNNLPTAFPFFNTSELTDECRLWNDNAWRVWQHLMPQYLTSFIIRRTTNIGHAISTFKYYREDGSLVGTISTSYLDLYEVSDCDYIVFNSTDHKVYLNDGYYYIEVSDGHTTWRSVRFQCKDHPVTPP